MLCFGRGENGLWGERSIASRSLDFLGPHLGPFVGAECGTCLLSIPERSRALLISPLFPNARLIHTVEVIGSNPLAPTIFSSTCQRFGLLGSNVGASAYSQTRDPCAPSVRHP